MFKDYKKEWIQFFVGLVLFFVISGLNSLNIIFPPITTLLIFGAGIVSFWGLDNIRQKEETWKPYIIGFSIFAGTIVILTIIDIILM